jgi:hypothetical protein
MSPRTRNPEDNVESLKISKEILNGQSSTTWHSGISKPFWNLIRNTTEASSKSLWPCELNVSDSDDDRQGVVRWKDTHQLANENVGEIERKRGNVEVNWRRRRYNSRTSSGVTPTKHTHPPWTVYLGSFTRVLQTCPHRVSTRWHESVSRDRVTCGLSLRPLSNCIINARSSSSTQDLTMTVVDDEARWWRSRTILKKSGQSVVYSS